MGDHIGGLGFDPAAACAGAVVDRAIAKHLGIARDTVARAVVAQRPPQYVRPPVVSRFDAFEPRVRELLKDFPAMPATVIAERVGWDGSASWFREKVARLGPTYAPRDPADRIEYRPGDQVQCDLWFPPVKIPLGSGQCGYSAGAGDGGVVLPVHHRDDAAVADHRGPAGRDVGAAVGPARRGPAPADLGQRGRHRAAQPLAAGVAGFCGALATRIVQLKPYDPESKGMVERANGYLETSFLPGRTFTSPADFNTQLGEWLPGANRRTVRALEARPVELIGIDRAAMLALPPVPPRPGFGARVRLPAGLLRPGGRQRLLRGPGRDRADGRGRTPTWTRSP